MSSRDVRSEATRRANLIEVLQDAHESCPEIPEEAAERWTEEAIRRWFSTNGAERPDDFLPPWPRWTWTAPPYPPSTRPDGMYLCQRIGCDAVYAPTDEGNPEDVADTTPPARVPRRRQIMELLRRKVARFRRVHEPPRVCRRSPHAEETPEARAEPEQRPRDVGPRPLAPSRPSRRRMPPPTTPRRGARGVAKDSSAATTPRARRRRRRTFPRRRQNARAAPPTDPADPDAVQICRNKGVREKFTEAENRDDACAYHPGPPIFHERKKGWSCCDRICYDFDEFMRIPPCTGGGTTRIRAGPAPGVRERTQK